MTKHGSFVILIKPNFDNVIGHGEPPKGLQIDADLILYDKPYKVSSKIDGLVKEQKPYNLINIDFVKKHEKQFKVIKEK